ncbi:hypothetical protein J7F03_34200 [Streptomyces sp. ISL-43]|uniref:hypothetical protein n=1 Tax=Streptomyces sp. ISL-43 TaxID=2819183 RepID=UPI001BE6F652|nr:hypothetical protein [Streptomyces sp. ISL-43]MBT2452024.1 hypothetical protein [Streptomyces sp. ISL-43]
MKKFTRAAATLILSVAALGLSLPTTGAALAGNCPTCIDNTSVTAELGPAWGGQIAPAGGCGNCWSDSALADPGPARQVRIAPANCATCWPSGVTDPARWNGGYGDA